MKKIGWAASLVFLAVLFYYPLVVIFVRGFSLDSLSYLLSQQSLELIWFTIWQAAISAIGATLLGLIFAYLLYRKYFWGQPLLRAIFTVPFVMPILVIAIAFSTFQISNVTLAIILSHIYINTSLVTRAVGSHWLGLDSEVDDAAALDGAGRFRVFLSITIFELREVIVSSFVLAFVYSAGGFATVLLLGNGLVNTIETAIYFKVFSLLDLSAATGLAIAQLLLTVAIFVLSNRLVKSDFGFGLSVTNSTKRLDSRDTPVLVIGAIALVGFISPIWNVFQIAFGAHANFGINESILIATLHSIRNVVIVLVLACLVGLFTAYQISHRSQGIRKLLGLIYLAPIGVSTVLIGLGYLLGFGSFRSNWLVIPLAETVLALPLVVRLISSALNSVEREQLEQGQIDGASAWQVFRFVEFPNIRSSFSAALGFAGVIALGDFGASSFLSFGDQETLPILLYRYFSKPGSDNYQMAMTLTAVFILATTLLIVITSIRTSQRIESAAHETSRASLQ